MPILRSSALWRRRWRAPTAGVTLRDARPGTVKLSLRTGPRVNATEVCRLLGGGGHAAAAGATVSGTMAQAKSAVLAAIAQVIGPLAP